MANYQATLQGVTMGTGTPYRIMLIDIPPAPTIKHDSTRTLADGVFQGLHRLASLVVTLTIDITGSSETALFTNYAALNAAWGRQQFSSVAMTVTLPYFNTRTLTGRPIEFTPPPLEPSHIKMLTIPRVICRFEVGNTTGSEWV